MCPARCWHHNLPCQIFTLTTSRCHAHRLAGRPKYLNFGHVGTPREAARCPPHSLQCSRWNISRVRIPLMQVWPRDRLSACKGVELVDFCFPRFRHIHLRRPRTAYQLLADLKTLICMESSARELSEKYRFDRAARSRKAVSTPKFRNGRS